MKNDYKKRPVNNGKEHFPVHTPIVGDHGGFVVNNNVQVAFEKVPLRKEPVTNKKVYWQHRRNNITDAENWCLGPRDWSTTSGVGYCDHSAAHRQETIPTDAVVNYPYPQGYTRNIEGFQPEERVPSEYYMNNAHPLHPREELRALSSKKLEHEGFVLGSIAKSSWLWPSKSAYPAEKPKTVEPTGFSRSCTGKSVLPESDPKNPGYVHPSVLKNIKKHYPHEYEEIIAGGPVRCSTTKLSFQDPGIARSQTAPADANRISNRNKHSGFHYVDTYRKSENPEADPETYVHPALMRKAKVSRRIEMEGDKFRGRTMYQSSHQNPRVLKGEGLQFPSSVIQQSSGFAKDQTGNPIGHNRAEILAENNHRDKSHPSVVRMQEAKYPIDFGKTPTNLVQIHRDAALL